LPAFLRMVGGKGGLYSCRVVRWWRHETWTPFVVH
jgi:hypothetical protein